MISLGYIGDLPSHPEELGTCGAHLIHLPSLRDPFLDLPVVLYLKPLVPYILAGYVGVLRKGGKSSLFIV